MVATRTMPRSDTGQRLVLSPPVFVGRQRELAALADALTRAPAVVLVEGEAGIGKSRLVQELLDSPGTGELRVLVGACPPVREAFTLGPIVDAARRATERVNGLRLTALAGALRPLFPEWTDGLPPAPEPVEDASAARHRLFRALAELLDALDVGVLVVEDVHWADEASMEFLLFLAAARPQRLSVVVTYRPEDVPGESLLPRLSSGLPAGTTRLPLTLDPLDVDGTSRLVSSMLAGEHITDEFARFVHECTEGVPLAMEESVRLMAERADLVHRQTGWARRRLAKIAVPPTIRDAVLERVRRLSPDAQAVLRAAAVLGDPTDEATLLRVAGVAAEQAGTGLVRALSSGLMVEDRAGMLAVRHTLARRAVYETIPARRRRALHLGAGQALEASAPPPAARLAYHFREAADIDRWRRYGEEAADLALAAGDEATAATLLHDLVVHAGLAARDVARLTNKIPLVLVSGDARFPRLTRALMSLLDSGELGPAEDAEVRCQLGRAYVAALEWNQARVELERAVPNLAHDPVAAARVMTLLGSPIGTRCPAREHLQWLQRAASVTLPAGCAERLLLLVNRVTALLLLGEENGWVEAAKLPVDAATGQERLQIACGHLNIGELATMWGQYAEAERRLAVALDIAGRHDYMHLRDEALATRAHLDWFTGAWAGLAERTGPLASNEETTPQTRLEATLVGGLLQAAAGSHAQATESFRSVLAEMGRRVAVNYRMEPAAALARLHLAAGHVGDALQATDEPIADIATKGVWLWATDIGPVRVETLLTAGRTDEAGKLVTAFGRGLRGRNAPAPKAALVMCRALLAEGMGELTRAAGLFARAAKSWEALPRPYDALLARERRARCLLTDGHRERALALLTDVHDGLSGLGTTRDADRVAHLLREQGMAVPRVWRGGQRGYGNQLSPRELEVVHLAAEGRTNKEIARVLCRSPNTVAVQLKSAMRKLDVASRTELAVSAIRTGMTSDGSLRHDVANQPDGSINPFG